MAGVRRDIGDAKVGFLLDAELRQCAVQLVRPLPGLAVDGVGGFDAHREVLEESVAAYQASQPQLPS